MIHLSARCFGFLFRPIPTEVLAYMVAGLVYVLSISRSAGSSLKFLLYLERLLYSVTGEEADRYGRGVHPKHRLTNYHEFFCNRLNFGEKVIDIGCGNGFLAYDMAEKAGAVVTAIERCEDEYRKAVERFSHPRVTYILGEAFKDLPDSTFETAVMSNVLEHIQQRVLFLRTAQERLRPKRWLLRVPLYERDWRVPLMEELGVDYRLNTGHHIEYTQESFQEELHEAGLGVVHLEVRWGEIWCEARSKLLRGFQ